MILKWVLVLRYDILLLTKALLVWSEGSFGQEPQHLQPVSPAMPPMMPEYFAPHTQLELGQSLVGFPSFPLNFIFLIILHGTE